MASKKLFNPVPEQASIPLQPTQQEEVAQPSPKKGKAPAFQPVLVGQQAGQGEPINLPGQPVVQVEDTQGEQVAKQEIPAPARAKRGRKPGTKISKKTKDTNVLALTALIQPSVANSLTYLQGMLIEAVLRGDYASALALGQGAGIFPTS